MAASLRRLGSCRNLTFCKIKGFYRTFLSGSYRCDPTWVETGPDELQAVLAEDYLMELLDKFDKHRTLHAVDVEIFTRKLPEVKEDVEHLARQIFFSFRHCQNSVPVRDSIIHAIIKAYMEKGWIDQLIEMIRNRNSYGIFPDEQGASILMDYLLQKNDYKNAVQIAYEVMLQEDFEHPIRTALALLSAVNYYNSNDGLSRYTPPVIDEEEEVEFIPVKVVHNQYYDDHFDICDEQFLLGKTLYLLAKGSPDLDQTVSQSLQLLGLGMYNKFKLGKEKMDEWGGNIDKSVLKKYLECLKEAPVRRDVIPDKPPSERVFEDELELKRITADEKAACLKALEDYQDRYQFPSLGIETSIETHVRKVVDENEAADKVDLKRKYMKWRTNREVTLEEESRKLKQEKRKIEIMEKLSEIQKKEELLTYFENQSKIMLYQPKKGGRKARGQRGGRKEQFVEAPGERNVKKSGI